MTKMLAISLMRLASVNKIFEEIFPVLGDIYSVYKLDNKIAINGICQPFFKLSIAMNVWK